MIILLLWYMCDRVEIMVMKSVSVRMVGMCFSIV